MITREMREAHIKWVNGEEGGVRLILREADLGGANLGWAYLGGADLGGAYLGGADLGGADLGKVYLGGADLGKVYLGGADLRGADLRGADLRGADLGWANLGWANLRGTGVLFFQVGPWWATITPDKAWIGCQEKTHEEWEALTLEQSKELDKYAEELWVYRDFLLSGMKLARELGWPKEKPDTAGAVALLEGEE